jgi:hypothetical protein
MAKGWALHTVLRPAGDPYTDRIWPITRPTHELYADVWGMKYDPFTVWPEDEAWMNGTVAANLGTQCVYASWPWRQRLLDDYDGFVYIDEDAPFLNHHRDLCMEVTEEHPIGMARGLTGALMVVKSTPETRQFLQLVWDMRHELKGEQWAEEGAVKKLLGWDHVWDPGKREADFKGGTEWTPRLRLLEWALVHPLDSLAPRGPWLAMNPGGVHPIEHRIKLIEEAVNGEAEYAVRVT